MNAKSVEIRRSRKNGRTVIMAILAAVAAAATACSDIPTNPAVAEDSGAIMAAAASKSTTLQAAAAKSGRYYGAAVQKVLLDGAIGRTISSQFGAVTSEYEMQWGQTEPARGVFDYSRADAIVAFASKNRLRMRGHQLLWHYGLPAWLPDIVTAANADSMVSSRIRSIVGRYAGRVASWDVVNEAIEPYDGLPNGMRNTLWLQTMGPDYVARAFTLAHEADPAAQLVYNEYNLTADAPDHAARRAAVLRLLGDLKARNIPVHALGIQGHINPALPFNPAILTTFLDQVAALGISVIVTELDVEDRSFPAAVTVRDSMVAATYTRYLTTFLSHPAVEGVMSWGIIDPNSWLAWFRPRADGQPVRPLLYDGDLRPKAAWTAVSEAFLKAPVSSRVTTTALR